jgi:hypothetical protein
LSCLVGHCAGSWCRGWSDAGGAAW